MDVVILVGAYDFLDFDAVVFKLLDEIAFNILLLVVPLEIITCRLHFVLQLLHDLQEDPLVPVILDFLYNLVE